MTDEPTEGGTLYVVATPIGNLADVTMRSIEVLNSVPLVAAEDTRLTRRLFARHGIETRLTPFHARSAPARLAELVGHLRSGSDLALVTDAGTPGVSDPGEALVASWAAEGGRVVPIPGASALLAAIVAAGIAGPRWSFEGFLPRTGRERQDRLARIAGDERGTVLFEAPGRLVGTLGDLAETCGTDRPATVCRELTKLHETIHRGTLGELARQVRVGEIATRGEITIVVGWWPAASVPAAEVASAGLEAALARVEALVASGVARGEAARTVARETGLPRRRLYEVAGRD